MSDFSDALKKHGISLQKLQVRKLEEYVHLLWSWNERLNLTRHTDYDKFAARDITDSLALAEFLRQGEKVLDVGTGGGVPGIILAVVRPDLNIELCDSTGKKALAVSEMLQELRLNIPVHHAKAETLLAEKGRRYTTLTIRAVSRLAQLLRHFAPCWSSFSRMLLVKGPNWIAERGEARHYNLTTKLALRRLKTYTAAVAADTAVPQNAASNDSAADNSAAEDSAETDHSEINHTATNHTAATYAESVILQLCLKEDFDQIDAVIDKQINKHRTHAPARFFRKGINR